MTEEDKIFCYHLTRAAKKLGIGAQLVPDPTGWSMNWIDPAVGRFIKTQPSADKQQAFFNGCQQLQNYLRL